GAVNLPVAELLADGRSLDPEALRARFAAAGVTDDRPVEAYCGSGVTAAQAVLALHRIGRTDAALYVGSWSHWITDPDRPIATGAQPCARPWWCGTRRCWATTWRSEEHTSELQSRENLVCRLLLEN